MPKAIKHTKIGDKYVQIVPDETKLQAQCFELYYSLGDIRTITKLSKKCITLKLPINYRTLRKLRITKWWEDRIKARDFDQIKAVRLQNNFDMTEIKQDYSKALRNLISTSYITDENDARRFDFKIRNIDDLERSIKLLMLLNGEATDIHSVRVEIITSIINNVVMILGNHIKDQSILSAIAADLHGGTKEITSEQ